jgi:hypothetical protein
MQLHDANSQELEHGDRASARAAATRCSGSRTARHRTACSLTDFLIKRQDMTSHIRPKRQDPCGSPKLQRERKRKTGLLEPCSGSSCGAWGLYVCARPALKALAAGHRWCVVRETTSHAVIGGGSWAAALAHQCGSSHASGRCRQRMTPVEALCKCVGAAVICACRRRWLTHACTRRFRIVAPIQHATPQRVPQQVRTRLIYSLV